MIRVAGTMARSPRVDMESLPHWVAPYSLESVKVKMQALWERSVGSPLPVAGQASRLSKSSDLVSLSILQKKLSYSILQGFPLMIK